MSTAAPLPAPTDEPAAGFFSRPANRWDLAKVLIPSLLALGWWLITLYFTSQAQGREQGDQRAVVTRLQQDREAGAARLAVLESKVEDVRRGQDEMRADVKTILTRLPERR